MRSGKGRGGGGRGGEATDHNEWGAMGPGAGSMRNMGLGMRGRSRGWRVGAGGACTGAL